MNAADVDVYVAVSNFKLRLKVDPAFAGEIVKIKGLFQRATSPIALPGEAWAAAEIARGRCVKHGVDVLVVAHSLVQECGGDVARYTLPTCPPPSAPKPAPPKASVPAASAVDALRDALKKAPAAPRPASELLISEIRRDGGTQLRGGTIEETLEAYALAITAGDVLPPVTAFRDADGELWLADGFHRVEAHLRAGKAVIAVKILTGSKRDALLHAVGCNAAHGLPRTNADKRRAVTTLLADPEWSQWSDRQIADRCRVDGKTVGSARLAMATAEFRSEPIEAPRRYTTKHGTEATMNTEPINAGRGKGKPAPRQVEEPSRIPYHVSAVSELRHVWRGCEKYPGARHVMVGVMKTLIEEHESSLDDDAQAAVADMISRRSVAK